MDIFEGQLTFDDVFKNYDIRRLAEAAEARIRLKERQREYQEKALADERAKSEAEARQQGR